MRKPLSTAEAAERVPDGATVGQILAATATTLTIPDTAPETKP
ncbi:hypothetical protein [Neoroseomonas soli]|nr:hypothetical protein [Neoroseomonas soli]